MNRLALAALLIGTTVCTMLSGQDLRVAPGFTPGAPDRVEVLVENLRGSAQSRRPIRAQDGQRLSLEVDGKPGGGVVETRLFRTTERGMAIVIAVDVSRTMAAGMPAIKEALRGCLKAFSAHDRVALISFADDIRVESPFDSGLAAAEKAVDRLQARGKITELHKAVFKGLDLLDAPRLPERRRLIILTDGKDEGVGYTLEDVLAKARRLGFPIDATGISQIDPKFLSVCERMADLTGGAYVHARALSDLGRILRQHVEGLQESPVFAFTPSSLPRDGGSHRVTLKWTADAGVLAGEGMVHLPPAPAAPQKNWRDHLTNPWVLGGGGGGILLLIMLFWAMAQRRTRRRLEAEAALAAIAALPEQPDPHEGGNPLYASDLNPSPRTLAEGSFPLATEKEAPVSRPRAPRRTQFQSEFRCDPPQPGHPAILLKAETGPVAGRVFPVETDPCWIGAEEDAAIAIPQDDFMSGFHAYLRHQGGLVYLFDQQSTNGTFKNDQKLTETSVLVSPGDRIRTGRTVFLVVQP